MTADHAGQTGGERDPHWIKDHFELDGDTAGACLDLSGAFPSPFEPDDLPARVCTCYGAVLRGEGSADEDCPLHGREAEERAAGDVELVDGLHPLCRDEHHVWVDCDDQRFPCTLYCHELAGHPPGEDDGGHGTRSGERW